MQYHMQHPAITLSWIDGKDMSNVEELMRQIFHICCHIGNKEYPTTVITGYFCPMVWSFGYQWAYT